MVALGGTYTADPNNVQGDYTPIPAGEYLVHVVASEFKENSARTGNYLQLEMEIIEGDQAGRKITDCLNLDNPNSQAVEIAERTLNAICVAIGKLSIADSDELHGIPMIAVIKVDPARTGKDGKEYGPSNSIRTYKPRGGAASPVAQMTPAAPAAQAAAPAAASGNTPPWKKKAA